MSTPLKGWIAPRDHAAEGLCVPGRIVVERFNSVKECYGIDPEINIDVRRLAREGARESSSGKSI